MSASVPIDSKQFRNALGAFTTGVTIVTTRDSDHNNVGLTANSFNSVSLDPPLVLWSLAKTSRALDAFVAAEHFAVHILSADQESLSNLFATRGADKFAGLKLERGPGGIPLIDGCAARFQCKTKLRYDGGDHEIFIGEVVAFDHYDRSPLLFHAGRYGLLIKPSPAPQRLEEPELSSSFSMDFLGYLLGVGYVQLFGKVRSELERWDLSGDQYWLLNLMSRFENRSVADLDALFSLSGRHVTTELVSSLIERGLIQHADDTSSIGQVKFTEAGRETMIQIVAMAKAVEQAAEQHLEYGEGQMLKHLLRRLISGTNPSATSRPAKD